MAGKEGLSKRHVALLKNIAAIASALDVSLSELFGFKE